MVNHNDFILEPIINILKKGISSLSNLGDTIETYPVQEHILRSIFIEMTGSQEQKMKCILWTLATYDYEFRYDFLKKNRDYGECSDLKDKSKVYGVLTKQIESLNPLENIEFKKIIFPDDETNHIKNNKIALDKFLSHSNTNSIFEKYIKMFQGNEITSKSLFLPSNSQLFTNKNQLLKNKNKNKDDVGDDDGDDDLKKYVISEIYYRLYKHRNRCAHNTLSYQKNLPTLNNLDSEAYKFDNYYIRFLILIFIDTIFIKTYEKYLEFKTNWN